MSEEMNQEVNEQTSETLTVSAPQGLPPPRWPHSTEFRAIAVAFAKAQLAIKGAVKDTTNPHFGKTYADLASVWDSCHEHLNGNGIAILQTTEVFEGKMQLVTRLIHGESGQWFRNEWPVKPQQDTPQGLGSAVTYARRYSLAAMAGVAPRGDDDDGNAASQPAQSKPQRGSSWDQLQGQPSNDSQSPEQKPQRPGPVEFAPLPEQVTSIPQDVAKGRRELERFADKPFAEYDLDDLKAVARALDAMAAKSGNPKNKMILATLGGVANAEFGKRAAGGAA